MNGNYNENEDLFYPLSQWYEETCPSYKKSKAAEPLPEQEKNCGPVMESYTQASQPIPAARTWDAPSQASQSQVSMSYGQTQQTTAFTQGTAQESKKNQYPVTRKFMAGMMAASVALSAAVGFTGGYMASDLHEENASAPIVAPTSNSTGSLSAMSAGGTMTIAQVTAKVQDSVVGIATETKMLTFFREVVTVPAAGSGVIISADGYIVTNNHVIEGADNITVTLQNGDSYNATVSHTDPASDIALLKIDANGLTPASFGNSDAMSVGDMAIAIGNPLGEFAGTVTSGIISALGRDLDIEGTPMHLMQTDAAINRGNSGGGLFNAAGELIGIIVAKSTGSSVEGLGFAIPSNNVVEVLHSFGYSNQLV